MEKVFANAVTFWNKVPTIFLGCCSTLSAAYAVAEWRFGTTRQRLLSAALIVAPYSVLLIKLDMKSFYIGGFLPVAFLGPFLYWGAYNPSKGRHRGPFFLGLTASAALALPNLGIFLAHSLKSEMQ